MNLTKVIYINGYFLVEKTCGGVNRFAKNVLLALDRLLIKENLDVKWVLLLPNQSTENLELQKIQIKKIGCFNNKYLWEQISLPYYVQNNFLINFANFAPIYKKNQLCVIHDALIFCYPYAYSKKFKWLTQFIHKKIVKSAKYIGTVSNFSASEIMKLIGKPQRPILILGNSAEHLHTISANLAYLKPYNLIKNSYILSVFSQKNSAYKNIDNYLKVVRNINYTFVCVGSVELDASKLPANLIQLGVVTDSQLKALYQNALATFVPSLYEGFGIPVLEAISLKSPLLISNIPVFREIVDEIPAIFFNPNDAQDMVSQVNNLINNPALRDRLIQKDNIIHKEYSYSQLARKIYRLVLDEIINENSYN